MTHSGIEPVTREWAVTTDCRKHGRRRQIVLTFGPQRPLEVVSCPPICPRCESVDGPQAHVVSVERLPDV